MHSAGERSALSWISYCPSVCVLFDASEYMYACLSHVYKRILIFNGREKPRSGMYVNFIAQSPMFRSSLLLLLMFYSFPEKLARDSEAKLVTFVQPWYDPWVSWCTASMHVWVWFRGSIHACSVWKFVGLSQTAFCLVFKTGWLWGE